MFSETQNLGASHPPPAQRTEVETAPAPALGLLAPASFAAKTTHGGRHDSFSDSDGFQTVNHSRRKKTKVSNGAASDSHNSEASFGQKEDTVLKRKPSISAQFTSHSSNVSSNSQPTISILPSSPLALLERTFSLKLPFEAGRLYCREQFLTIFRQRGIDAEYIEAMGPLNQNSQWHITFTADAPQHMLSEFNLQPLVIGGRRAQVQRMSGHICKVRAHWAPYFIPQAAITAELSRVGKVKSFEFEKSIVKGLEHCKTLVRLIEVEASPVDIPHIVRIPFNGTFYPVLLTVQGRPPLCLRCEKTGHIRKDCQAPFCRHCRVYDHTSEDCAARNLYASRVKANAQTERVEDMVVEGEELNESEKEQHEENSRRGEGQERSREETEKVHEEETKEGQGEQVSSSDQELVIDESTQVQEVIQKQGAEVQGCGEEESAKAKEMIEGHGGGEMVPAQERVQGRGEHVVTGEGQRDNSEKSSVVEGLGTQSEGEDASDEESGTEVDRGRRAGRTLYWSSRSVSRVRRRRSRSKNK